LNSDRWFRSIEGVTERLAELFESAKEIVFNNSSRWILLSDCHRGGIVAGLASLQTIKWWVKTREDESLFVGKDRLVEESWRLGSSSAL
jgi:hypothetical protein